MALLEVRDVTLRFGGIVALDGVSFDVQEGQISGLIGPNGAGKTTAFNVITRLYKPDSGDVLLDGSSLLKQPAHRIVRKGVARTFQNIQLFRTMSVLENVLIGAHGRGRKVGEKEALEVLDVVGLRDRTLFPAAALPYGIQKRVELARALVARPRLLLLDEPAGGLNHEEVAELGEFIRKIRDDFELTILLVEHHMNLVMSISDDVTVMSFGRQISSGSPTQVQADPAVIEAYLGADDEHEPEMDASPETPTAGPEDDA
jgi:branched-chain amino acid transport system ATP-binding protein